MQLVFRDRNLVGRIAEPRGHISEAAADRSFFDHVQQSGLSVELLREAQGISQRLLRRSREIHRHKDLLEVNGGRSRRRRTSDGSLHVEMVDQRRPLRSTPFVK